MKVIVLKQFLQNLASTLRAAGDAAQSAHDLDQACHGLDPFQSLTIPEFFAFLQQAEQYRRSGAVRVPTSSQQDVDSLLRAFSHIDSDSNDQRLSEAQESVRSALERMAALAGLKGSLKTVPGWMESRQARARVAPYLRTIRELAARITDPSNYNDPSIHEGLAAMQQGLDKDLLKALAHECGVTVTAKSKADKVLLDALIKLTGHAPPRAKAQSGRTIPAVDLSGHIQRLKELMERSNDPELLPESEVEATVVQLQSLPKPALFEVANQAGIEGVFKSTPIEEILRRVRNRLNVGRRARERAEV